MSTGKDVILPTPGDDEVKDRVVGVLKPLLRITAPKLYGAENLPKSGGALLVGNHTIYGLLDLPMMMAAMWTEHRFWARGLGEHAHFKLPIWPDLLQRYGMVRGTRENVHALMEAGENILVFPGGAREVNKRKGEKYQLMWKERLGFAKLAIAHDYPIVPFASVGAEEMYDIVLDDNHALYGRFTDLVKKNFGVPLTPIVRGVGPTMLPRPEKLYFWFGEPVRTGGREPADVRDEVKAAVEYGIEFLHDERDADPDRGLRKRLLGR